MEQPPLDLQITGTAVAGQDDRAIELDVAGALAHNLSLRLDRCLAFDAPHLAAIQVQAAELVWARNPLCGVTSCHGA